MFIGPEDFAYMSGGFSSRHPGSLVTKSMEVGPGSFVTEAMEAGYDTSPTISMKDLFEEAVNTNSASFLPGSAL
ncbi:hypothetical protein Nepgr_019270 [Nepenthes gracilis]|uniref:Uncharacterized protein n=1 Tax=Nepenthes gracilis TaxID=150966 RepID=A0AAD3XUV6_NEPGR|nr:hypothetical protein Nepgr_019270 [Nepenthes gracilis]